MSPVETYATPRQTPYQLFRRFLRFGLLAWGGPTAQIAMIRRELVDEERWLAPEKFNRVLAVYQALPGPEAHELCVYFGMIAGGRRGAMAAGLGFMAPGFLLMLALTVVYAAYGLHDPTAKAVFAGIQAAVVALVLTAVPRLGRHLLVERPLWAIAAVAALCAVLGVHFSLILTAAGLAYVSLGKGYWPLAVLAGAALLGWGIWRFTPETLSLASDTAGVARGFQQGMPLQWFAAGLKGGLLSFGGAYTAIPIMERDAVAVYGWTTPGQFLDGLALSGVLPAPLIIFSTFVGWFGGGVPGACVVTAGVFLPAFSFTLIGHHYMERLIANPALHRLLDGVGAGVTGLIAATALRFLTLTIHSVFDAAICAAALIVLHRYTSKYVVPVVVFGAAIAAWLRLTFLGAL